MTTREQAERLILEIQDLRRVQQLSLVEAALRDCEAENQSVIDALRLTVADALDAIRQLEKDKRDCEAAQRERCAQLVDGFSHLSGWCSQIAAAIRKA